MVAAKGFLEAYCKLPLASISEITSDMEVRCVMHVQAIKVDTRAEFKNLLHIGKTMYDEAKQADPMLPKWGKLVSLDDDEKKDEPSGQLHIKELREDGKIPNAELYSMGFVIGETI